MDLDKQNEGEEMKRKKGSKIIWMNAWKEYIWM